MKCGIAVVFGLAMALAAQTTPPWRQVTRVRYTAADQEVSHYAYVPFTVPPGTTRLTLTYRYDRAGGANAVDLGVYEPGLLDTGTPALRGWSGGARDTIAIGVGDASPGYWPGPLPSGEWHAVLGLYKVAPDGVEVELTVDCRDEPATTAPAVGPLSSAPVRDGAQWYMGVLHAHTVHSDGELTPDQLVRKASEERLDFLAITDHNNTTHQRAHASAAGLLVITGEEVTTPVGHFNVWGLGGTRDYVDFRVGTGDVTLDRVMSGARDRGAVVSINHPVSECRACSWTAAVPDSVGAVEIANGGPEARRQAMLLWDSLLRTGRHVTAVDGSDWHRGSAPLAHPAVRIWATELSTIAVLDALRRGRVVVLADGRLPAPELEARSGAGSARIGDTLVVPRGTAVVVTVRAAPEAYPGARVDVLWNGEVVSSNQLDGALISTVRHPTETGYLRAHLVGHGETLLAVTNPVYIATR